MSNAQNDTLAEQAYELAVERAEAHYDMLREDGLINDDGSYNEQAR